MKIDTQRKEECFYHVLRYFYGSNSWSAQDAIDELRGLRKTAARYKMAGRYNFGWTDPSGVFGSHGT